jgi:hypothetical protein
LSKGFDIALCDTRPPFTDGLAFGDNITPSQLQEFGPNRVTSEGIKFWVFDG